MAQGSPVQETWVRSLGREDPLEREMATYSSILAWGIPRTEKPGGLQSMKSQEIGYDLATKQQSSFSWCIFIHVPAPWNYACFILFSLFLESRWQKVWAFKIYSHFEHLLSVWLGGNQCATVSSSVKWVSWYFLGLELLYSVTLICLWQLLGLHGLPFTHLYLSTSLYSRSFPCGV